MMLTRVDAKEVIGTITTASDAGMKLGAHLAGLNCPLGEVEIDVTGVPSGALISSFVNGTIIGYQRRGGSGPIEAFRDVRWNARFPTEEESITQAVRLFLESEGD